MRPRNDTCCNPFKIAKHGKKPIKCLRWINTSSGKIRICNSCRLRMNKMPLHDCESDSMRSLTLIPEANNAYSSDSSISSEASLKISKLNESLLLFGDSPIHKRKIVQKKYVANKKRKINSLIIKKLFDSSESVNEGDDIISKLKETYKTTFNRELKIKILTLFADWSYSQIQRNFSGATRHMISVAKNVVKEKGFLASPNPKPGKHLTDEIVNKVIEFYGSQEISRVMPGKKDCVKIGNETVQKRLVLCNLKEVHVLFKEKHPEAKIQFSKFAELRPKYCILPGATGTHSVCVCSIHQNVKLMIDGSSLSRLTSDNLQIVTYNDCLSKIICNPPTHDCYLRRCELCPGCDNLIEQLKQIFHEKMIDSISYKQWVTTDRCALETLQSSTDDFFDKFSEKLRRLLTHSYVAKEQHMFFNKKKKELHPGECVVISDFSENYAFVIQDSIQGAHWNNDQVTIHPMAIYYQENGEEKFTNYVAISECLKHDTVAVNLFQNGLISFLKNSLGKVEKIFYFSDGASAQYKNKKKFSNLVFHENDFGVKAEWHFFATSHGKGPCDGLGGTIKRLAARASLTNINSPINTPYIFFSWVKHNVKNVNTEFFTIEQYNDNNIKLQERFSKATTIRGTLGYHSFVPTENKQITVQITSLGTDAITTNICEL